MTNGPTASSPSQQKALAVLALVSVAALVRLSLPVATGIFFGMLLAFSLLRTHERLTPWVKRPGVSAVMLAVGAGLVVIGALATLLYLVVARGVVAANQLAHGFDPEGSLRRLDALAHRLPIGNFDVEARVREAAAQAATELTGWAASVAGATLGALLTLFFTVLTCFFVLLHWSEIVLGAERMLPLHPLHTRVVLAEFQRVGKRVFVGTILTGIVQGMLGGVAYALAGVPEAALLGALTAVSSLIPVVGTVLVWGPVGIASIASNQLGPGLFVLIWGGLLVALGGEYVVRPRLVGGKSHVPTLITFVSLFGGVQVFGLPGLIMGPVVASVALAILRTYDSEVCAGPETDEP
jgi:predicted PurR-regulated permease PerM